MSIKRPWLLNTVYERKDAGGLLAMAIKQEYESREYYGWYLQGHNYVPDTRLS